MCSVRKDMFELLSKMPSGKKKKFKLHCILNIEKINKIMFPNESSQVELRHSYLTTAILVLLLVQ